jgi:hypothetical protein
MNRLFGKPFEEIEFTDIEELIENKTRENITLDYKEQFGNTKSIANLVSAFANTHGGFIVIGIREKENSSEPERIVELTDTNKVLESKINNCCYDNITPPVFVRTKILEKDSKRIFLVNIPESDLTPHAVDNGTTVYIKVNDQKFPIKKANLDKIDWLKKRRQKYIDFRESIIAASDKRVEAYAPHKGRFSLDIVIIPKFPKAELYDFTIFNQFADGFLKGHIQKHPYTIIGRDPSINYDGGIINISFNRNANISVYHDFNCYGHFRNFSSFWGDKEDEDDGDNMHVISLCVFLIHGLEFGFEFLNVKDFVGKIIVSAKLRELKDSKIYNSGIPSGIISFNKGIGKCEVDNELLLRMETEPQQYQFFLQDFLKVFISRLAFLYGANVDPSKFSESVYDRAMVEYSK